jgi:hypothetical protein
VNGIGQCHKVDTLARRQESGQVSQVSDAHICASEAETFGHFHCLPSMTLIGVNANERKT